MQHTLTEQAHQIPPPGALPSLPLLPNASSTDSTKRPTTPISEYHSAITSTAQTPFHSVVSSPVKFSSVNSPNAGNIVDIPHSKNVALSDEDIVAVNRVMDSAHKLTGKLQKLLEKQQDVKLSGGKHPPSYSQLVVKLDTLFNNQKAINEANTKLTAMNTAATVSNYIRNKQLSHQMRSLQYNMSILEGTVDELQIEVVYQRGIIDRLRGEVKALKGCFDEAVKRYRQELEAQRKILRKQQASINSLFQASRTQDLILDSILLFTCLSISSLPLVTSFIQILTVAIRRDRSRQRWREGLRFMLFLYLIRRGRNMMQFYGVYKGVGKVEWWLANLAKGLGIDDKKQGKNIQG